MFAQTSGREHGTKKILINVSRCFKKFEPRVKQFVIGRENISRTHNTRGEEKTNITISIVRMGVMQATTQPKSCNNEPPIFLSKDVKSRSTLA